MPRWWRATAFEATKRRPRWWPCASLSPSHSVDRPHGEIFRETCNLIAGQWREIRGRSEYFLKTVHQIPFNHQEKCEMCCHSPNMLRHFQIHLKILCILSKYDEDKKNCITLTFWRSTNVCGFPKTLQDYFDWCQTLSFFFLQKSMHEQEQCCTQYSKVIG